MCAKILGWTHRGKVANDCWVSHNGGEHWRPAASSSSWAPRELFRELAFEGCNGRPEIILFGGRDLRGNQLADCYKSDEQCHTWHAVACRGVEPASRASTSRNSARLSARLSNISPRDSARFSRNSNVAARPSQSNAAQSTKRSSMINRSSMSMATASGVERRSVVDESPIRRALASPRDKPSPRGPDPVDHGAHAPTPTTITASGARQLVG